MKLAVPGLSRSGSFVVHLFFKNKLFIVHRLMVFVVFNA